jgi:hypothetical protein
VDARSILAVCGLLLLHYRFRAYDRQDSDRVLHYFSAEKRPTLWRVLPAIEELQMAWEAKRDDEKYILYRSAIQDGLDKLNKYYSRFDQKPCYILALGKFCCNIFSDKGLTQRDQSFTPITNSRTSSLHGAVQKNRLRNEQQVIDRQKTGRMRQERLSKRR